MDVDVTEQSALPDDARLVDQAEESFGKRANKRVMQALSGRKAAETERDAARSEAAELRRLLQQQNAHRAIADEQVIAGRVGEAERAFRSAKETGDLTAELTAQRQMVSLEVQLDNARKIKAQAEFQAAQAPKAAAAVQLSPAMQGWLDRGNDEWFRRDDAMTTASVGFDKAARNAGHAPESKAYFDFIDKKMASAFPEHFADGGTIDDDDEVDDPTPVARPVVSQPVRRTTPTVAPAPSRTIRLTSEEREVARALGMTDQQYAANKSAK